MENPMTKQELIDAVSLKTTTPLTKTAINDALTALCAVVQEQLAKGEPESVTLHGLGAFVVKAKPARTGRNPQTGEPLAIPAKNVVSFKVSKTLKDAVN